MEDKTKFKNWKDGDIFAIKIDNGGKYDGRYILLEVHTKVVWGNDKTKYFRAKLTKDSKLPSTLNDINNAQYIKEDFSTIDMLICRIGFETFDEAMERVKQQNYDFDEYDYVYTYYFKMCKINEIINQLIYIGNFDCIKRLKYERIPQDPFDGLSLKRGKDLVNYLLERYELFNLKLSYVFTEEGIKEGKIKSQEEISFQKNEMDELMRKLKNKEIVEPTIPEYEWGPKLYDIDQAYEYKNYFKQVYSKEKSLDSICKELAKIAEEETKYNDEKSIFWMVIADNCLKKGMMNQELKNLTLKCIDINLKLWEPHQYYKEREKELNKLKKKLEEYECKE